MWHWSPYASWQTGNLAATDISFIKEHEGKFERSADDRFREMFFEEARELLISLEEGLMDLERRQNDRAHLDKTFRAAHSLKGAAAMVGLGSIAEFTHGIEAVLEQIRGGSLAVDSDIITTLLEARDHLAAMVEAEAARSPIPPSGELTQRLASLLRGPSPARPDEAASAPPRPAGSAALRRLRGLSQPHAAPPSAPADGPRQSRKPKEGNQPLPDRSREQKQKPRAPRKKIQKMGPPPDRTPVGSRRDQRRRMAGPAAEDLPGHADARSRRVAARDQPAGSARRAPRSGRDLDRHRPGPGAPTRPDRSRNGATCPGRSRSRPTRIRNELREAFLFFAEDSTAAIERLNPQGKWQPVRVGEAAAAAPGGTAVPPRQEAPPSPVGRVSRGPASRLRPAAPTNGAGSGSRPSPAVSTAAPGSSPHYRRGRRR